MFLWHLLPLSLQNCLLKLKTNYRADVSSWSKPDCLQSQLRWIYSAMLQLCPDNRTHCTVLCCAVLMQQHTSKCEHWEASVCRRQQREVRVPTLQEDRVWWYIWASTRTVTIKSPSRWRRCWKTHKHPNDNESDCSIYISELKRLIKVCPQKCCLRNQQIAIRNIWQHYREDPCRERAISLRGKQ